MGRSTPIHQPDPEVQMDQWREVAVAEVDKYNAAALEIVQREDIPVNDLHEVIIRNGFANCVCEDGFHMAPFGNEVLSDAVVEAVRAVAGDRPRVPPAGAPCKRPARPFWTT